MAGTGAAPNPASRRSTGPMNSAWVDLPAEGFDGPTPAWPLPDLNPRELEVWVSLWCVPAAAAWVRFGWTHDVAMYVRHLVLAENGNLDHAKEARMWSDRLGLNPTAMLKNRWRIRRDELGEQRATTTGPTKKARTRRALKVAGDE